MTYQFRRVVVGENAQGESALIADSLVPVRNGTPDYLQFAELWRTTGRAGEIPGRADTADADSTQILPEAGGTRFLIEVAHPEGSGRDSTTVEEMFRRIGAQGARTHSENDPHPGMHRTETVDYIYILAGEITLILDTQEIPLRQGDIVVDAGANHSWANRSTAPCVLLAVVVGARRG